MGTSAELVAERLSAILGEKSTTPWQIELMYACAHGAKPGEHAGMNLEDLLDSYGFRRGQGDKVSSPPSEKRGATKPSRTKTKATLDASAAPFVPLATKKLDASAAPFVPAGKMSAAAAPFVPQGPAILKLGSTQQIVPPSGKLSATAAPFVPKAAASFDPPKRTAKAAAAASLPPVPATPPPDPAWLEIQKLLFLTPPHAGKTETSSAPSLQEDSLGLLKLLKGKTETSSVPSLQEDSVGPPPPLLAGDALGEKPRERAVSTELSEQSTASGSPSSSPGPSPKPMYSLQDLLRFRLPAAEEEKTPHLYSTMPVKDLEARSPKTPPSTKKEKRGERASPKARGGAKMVKQKVESWR